MRDVVLAAAALLPIAAPAGGQSSANGAWHEQNPMPRRRYGSEAVVVGQKIYVIGGNTVWGGDTTSNWEYTPGASCDRGPGVIARSGFTCEWQPRASMPTRRGAFSAAAVNDKVYVVGGHGAGGFLDLVEVYDPATNSWSQALPMPTARDGLSCVALNGKVYALGGETGLPATGACEAYDPVSDSWAVLAPMPTPRVELAAAALGGKIYAIGGFDGPELDTVEEYDPTTDSWRTVMHLQRSRDATDAVALDGRICVIGGSSLRTVEQYDPVANDWVYLAPIGARLSTHASVVFGGEVYVFGGQEPYFGFYLATRSVRVYSPRRDPHWR